MPTNQKMKRAIQSEIKSMMDRVMELVLVEKPFLKEEHHDHKPLYAALVPDEIFKGSHFERKFVTQFGNAWERLAGAAAKEGLGYSELHRQITGNVTEGQLQRIQKVLNDLEYGRLNTGKVKPDWTAELNYIKAGLGEKIPTTVICDIYVENTETKERFAFELKAPMPNSDQTKVSKEKLLKLYCMKPSQIDEAYFALTYNPYGKREDYAWSFPFRWFDMKNDKVVLIGDETWDKIGGVGTYQSFIEAVEEMGDEYKARIYKEFLQKEPPIPRTTLLDTN